MRTWLLRHPLLLWVLYLLTVVLIALAAGALFPALRSGPSGLSTVQLAGQLVLTLLPLPFLAVVGWRVAGFNGPRQWRDLHLLAFPALTVAFGYLAGFREMDFGYLATAVALVVLVAFGEEAAFRGVLLKALEPRGVMYAVLVSSALFGLMHLGNLALGAPWQGVLLQVLFSGMGGVGFAAIRIRTNSLWPVIVLHASYDLAFRVGNMEPGTMMSNAYFMLHGVGWLVFAFIVLRPERRHDVVTV